MSARIEKFDQQIFNTRIDRIINAPLRYDVKTRTTEMDLPGFSYSLFNRVGVINIWSLLKSIEAINMMESKVYPVDSQEGPNIAHITVGLVIDVHPKLYEDASIVMPTTASSRLAHVGNRSYGIYTDLRGKDNGIQYVRNQRSLCLVNMDTEKVILMPKHLRDSYEKLKDPHAKPIFIDQPKAPDHALKFDMIIPHSDTDQVYHSNHSSYFRYCLDAAAFACDENKFKNFHGDLFHYKVSRAEVRYQGETFSGDKLDITFWESEQSSDTLHFLISKNNSVTTKVNLKFFQEDLFPVSKL